VFKNCHGCLHGVEGYVKMRFRIIISLFFVTILSYPLSNNSITSVYEEPEDQKCGRRTILSLDIDPKNPDNIYAGVSTNMSVEFYKSVNNGKNWHIMLRLKGDNKGTLAINPYDSQIIYAGRHKSIDGGKTWEPSGLISYLFSYLTIHPVDKNIVYAITRRDIYRTTGDDKNWFIIKKDCRAFEMDIKKPNELYAYCGEESGEGIYKSIDSGVNWERMMHVNNITPAENAAKIMHSPLPKFTIAIDPKDSTIYAAGMKNVYRSTDGGQRWNTIKSDFPDNMRINVLTIDPVHSNRLYIGTNHGIFKSIDRSFNWRKINNGLPERLFVDFLVVNPRNPNIIYIGTSGSGIFKSVNGGGSWQPINNGLPCSPPL